MKLSIPFIICILMMVLSSCGQNEVDCSDLDSAIAGLENEINQVTVAEKRYNDNKSDINFCIAYRNALQSLIDYSQNLYSCDGLDQAAIEANVIKASQDRDDLPC